MPGGLYDDLPPPSDDEKPSGNSSVWSSSTMVAPPTLPKPPASAPPKTPSSSSGSVPNPPSQEVTFKQKMEVENRRKALEAKKRELDNKRKVEEDKTKRELENERKVEEDKKKLEWKKRREEIEAVMNREWEKIRQEKKERDNSSVNSNGEATRVLLLRNMVGPGEVDGELEDEVETECGKYGTVTRVRIFEVTEPNFPVHEAVRIFVQFSRPEETAKALENLDGRYFVRRTVRATFYDEKRFSNNELAPVPGEIPAGY